VNRQRIVRALNDNRLAAVVATAPENINYAVAYEGLDGPWRRDGKAAIIPASDSTPISVVAGSEVGFMLRAGVDQRATLYRFGPLPRGLDSSDELSHRFEQIARARNSGTLAEAIIAALKGSEVSGGRVAVDETGSPEVLRMLREVESDYEFLSHGNDVLALGRMVKSADEIDLLRRASAVNEAGIQAVLAVAADLDSSEIERLHRTVIASLGGLHLHFQMGVGASGFQHAGGSPSRFAGVNRWKPRRPATGSVVFWDAALSLDGYISDLGGTYSIREPASDGDIRMYSALEAGIQTGLEHAQPGVRASKFREVVLESVRQAGAPEYSGAAGHGVGTAHHEFPLLRGPMKTSSPFLPNPFDPELEVGMVLAIEITPPGLQDEVICAVTHEGGRLLSRRRELVVVGA